MNDFTREELLYLYETVNHVCYEYDEPDMAYTLRDKLKSISDNYDVKVINAWHCEKCGHVQ